MTKIDKHPAGTVSWVDLMTTDPEAARAFYAALFGWAFELGGPESGHYAIATLEGRPVCGIGGIPPGASSPAAWSVYFASDDLDATVALATGAGGAVTMAPMDVMEQGRMAVITDPTGAVFGVWQAKQHLGAQVIDEPGAMCWREVNTRDADQARAFYGKVFGLEAKPLEERDGPSTQYWTLHRGPITVGGVMQMTQAWEGIPPHWMSYFAVQDADAAAEKLERLGGKVSVPPFDTPYGRIAVVHDPQGAVFSIIAMAKRR